MDLLYSTAQAGSGARAHYRLAGWLGWLGWAGWLGWLGWVGFLGFLGFPGFLSPSTLFFQGVVVTRAC